MYEDKTLVCKDCGNEFVFTAGEQEFYAREVSPMSRSAARLAVMQSVAAHRDRNVRCSLLSAIPAAARQEFRSSP